MKLMILADIHGYIKNIPLLAYAAQDCDVILLAGDITDFGLRKHAQSVLAALSALKKPVLGVDGNCDPPEVGDFLQQESVSLVHHPVEINGVIFIGFSYPASEVSILSADRYLKAHPTMPAIVVSHQPAWGTAVDLQAGSRHKGSQLIRSFIEDYQPLAAVSGHIHEARGVDTIGSTVLVNPGPFRDGCYAIIDLTKGISGVRLCVL